MVSLIVKEDKVYAMMYMMSGVILYGSMLCILYVSYKIVVWIEK